MCSVKGTLFSRLPASDSYRPGACSLLTEAGKLGCCHRQLQSPGHRSSAWFAVLVTSAPLFTQEEPGNEKQVALSHPKFLAAISGLRCLPRCQRCCEMRLASGTELQWPTLSQLPYHTSQAGCALKHTSPALACCKQKPWAPTVPQVVSYFLWLDCRQEYCSRKHLRALRASRRPAASGLVLLARRIYKQKLGGGK